MNTNSTSIQTKKGMGLHFFVEEQDRMWNTVSFSPIFEGRIVVYGLVIKKDSGFFLDFLHENQASTPYKIECTPPSVVMKLLLSCHVRQVTTRIV